MLFGVPVYRPWNFFVWWFEFDAYAPRVFVRGGFIAASGGLLGAAAAIIGSVWRARQAKRVTTYGSAHWASPRDLKRSGLLTPAGVFLGRMGEDYLRHGGPEHVMAFAPTRSGKGLGLVVPTLLSWTGSAVIHDIKGENWTVTAGWRSRFSHCLYVNPTDPSSAAYNPLLEVRRGVQEVRDVQNIADVLVDPEGSIEKRNHWEKTSHSLLVGAILHVLYAGQDRTLCGVANFLSDPAHPFDHTLRMMMTTAHLGHQGVHPVVASSAREVLNKSENERSGVLSTAMSFLDLYRDPTIAAVTSRCDWRIADLISAEHPVSLYLVVPPSDISRTKPLIRLILNQIGRRLTESLDGSDGIARKHKLLLMLDEFPALGRLDFFESALAFMAGYGLRAFLIAQSLNQIEKAYGPNNAILDNCHVRIAFASNDERTAKRISDALGAATELRAQKNYAGHRLSPWLGHLMVSRQETARQLLTPGEVMQLPPEDEIIMVSGQAHLRTLTIRGFPASTWPGLLDEMNRLGFSYRWVSRFLFLDKPEAERALMRLRRQWFAKRKGVVTLLRETIFQQESPLVDSDAANKALDADEALQLLGSDAVAFGHLTATVTVWDEDARVADERQKAVMRVIQGRGFVALPETLNAVEAWLSSIPGHVYANVRQPIVSTLNLAHLMPLSAVWAGPERNEHLDGPPLLITRTEGTTPFRLTTHVGDVGHALVAGPTGAGKSVLLATLILQFRKYSDAQIYVFDKGRSVRAAMLGLGGEFHDLGLDGGLAFQPLRDIDDPATRAWASEWVQGLLGHERVELTPEIKDAVWSALGSLASAPVEERTLTGLSGLLQTNRLRQALQPYTLDGPFGRLCSPTLTRSLCCSSPGSSSSSASLFWRCSCSSACWSSS